MCTQTSLPGGYRLSIIDVGLVIEFLIGGAYCSTYTQKHFRAAYSRLQKKVRICQLTGDLLELCLSVNVPGGETGTFSVAVEAARRVKRELQHQESRPSFLQDGAALQSQGCFSVPLVVVPLCLLGFSSIFPVGTDVPDRQQPRGPEERWPRRCSPAPLLQLQRPVCVGRAAAAPADGAVPVAARRRGAGPSYGGL